MTNQSYASYEVPDMELIPQRHTMSCWYASARMLLNWKANSNKAPRNMTTIPEELDRRSRSIRDSNSGIGNPEVMRLASRLGLVAIPPISVTSNVINEWLQEFGPLWVNGTTHIVVIAGERGGDVKVYDPAPMNVGKVEWRSYEKWYEGSAVDSRDISSGVQTVFLHCGLNSSILPV